MWNKGNYIIAIEMEPSIIFIEFYSICLVLIILFITSYLTTYSINHIAWLKLGIAFIIISLIFLGNYIVLSLISLRNSSLKLINFLHVHLMEHIYPWRRHSVHFAVFAFVFMLSIHLSICLRLLRICSAVCLVVRCSCLLLLNYWSCLCFSRSAPPVLTAKLVNRASSGAGLAPIAMEPIPETHTPPMPCCLEKG